MATKTIAVLTTLVVLASATTSFAQPQTSGFLVNRYEPSERGSEWFSVESLDLRGEMRGAIGVVADYAARPLVIYNGDDTVRASIVRNRLFAHLGGAITLFERLRLGVSLPIGLYQDGNSGAFAGVTYSPPSAQAIGDLRLTADVRLVGVYGDKFTMAAGVQLFAPTGSRADYSGDGNARVLGRLLAAGDIGQFVYAARVGVEYRPLDENFAGGSLGSELMFGASAGVRVADKKLVVGPELFGSTVLRDAFGRRATPLEALFGAHYTAGDFRFGGGIGTGLTRGFGAPVAHALLSIEWAPGPKKEPPPVLDRDHDGILDDVDACPDTPGVRTADPKTNGCPPKVEVPDRDKDGIPDSEDACPDVPGVRTNDPKTNGCPPDRDHDGVPDSEDACPDVPGIKTNDPKTNGCPSDRDHDGIIDSEDACPDVPGVRTADPKTNGCPPDPDRDKDGIPNEQDACPDEAGPPSPDPKRNGCPKAFVQAGQIKILDQVKFASGSAAILPAKDSQEVLEAVSKVMKDHPEIKKIRVEGHTDNQGGAAYNKGLSQARAAAVVRWLVAHGIDAARLVSAGFGQEKPIDKNDTEANRRNNRRVEFHIEEESK